MKNRARKWKNMYPKLKLCHSVFCQSATVWNVRKETIMSCIETKNFDVKGMGPKLKNHSTMPYTNITRKRKILKGPFFILPIVLRRQQKAIKKRHKKHMTISKANLSVSQWVFSIMDTVFMVIYWNKSNIFISIQSMDLVLVSAVFQAVARRSRLKSITFDLLSIRSLISLSCRGIVIL